jgi:hypothetical protein
MQLTLPPQLEARLKQEAARRGMAADACALHLLEQSLPAEDRRSAGVAMLERWALEAENLSEEEAAENAAVLRAIDEDRLSDRKLFTDILRDAQQ